MPHYAKCDVISGQKQKIQTEISHQQRVGVQKYKRSFVTVLKVLSHNAKIFVSKHFKQNTRQDVTGERNRIHIPLDT